MRRSRWTKEQETQAIYLAGRGLDTEEIADYIGICSGDAVRVKLQRLGVSLRNQAKYRHGRTVPVHLGQKQTSRTSIQMSVKPWKRKSPSRGLMSVMCHEAKFAD